MISTNENKPTIINENEEEKSDEEETTSWCFGAHSAAGQLWAASRITNAQ
jgi:hypothetical protein